MAEDWQTESDAYALLQAQQVKDDPARFKKAQRKLDQLAKDKAEEASAARRARTGRKQTSTSNDTGNPPTSRPPATSGQSRAIPGAPSGKSGSIMGE
jgi:septal ring factor EnvC (AmiA/AmiB activator)